jgi:hypothetical protein
MTGLEGMEGVICRICLGTHCGHVSEPPVYALPPEAVFAVLSDGDRYAGWVVGAHTTAGTDPRWPGAGSSFAHRARFYGARH